MPEEDSSIRCHVCPPDDECNGGRTPIEPERTFTIEPSTTRFTWAFPVDPVIDVRPRAAASHRVAIEPSVPLVEETRTCRACSQTVPMRETLRRGSGTYYCRSCAGTCIGCGINFRNERLGTATNGDRMCSSCRTTCTECNLLIGRNQGGYTRYSARVHRECATFCEDCNYYFTGDSCPCSGDRLTGLTGYGRTRASRWLGGPLPKVDGKSNGFYLGIELEISAERGSVRPVHQWALENFGYSDALDCKQDSTVRGFEIATQPMTPEFFESVNWESFFKMLNEKFPLGGQESVHHGLHVHIGRKAFDNDDIAMAAFSYLLAQDDHLERIGRRAETSYCEKTEMPVSSAILNAHANSGDRMHQVQARRARGKGAYPRRGAINLTSDATIEIRSFRSTRNPDELRDAVRLVYVAAHYIRHLRSGKGFVSPRALHWPEFSRWVGANYPEAFASIAGINVRKRVKDAPKKHAQPVLDMAGAVAF